MAIDIYNKDGTADGSDDPIKHATIITNYGVPSGLNRFPSNDAAVFNKPIITEISGKYDAKFDNINYY